jgi:acyl carrier protein
MQLNDNKKIIYFLKKIIFKKKNPINFKKLNLSKLKILDSMAIFKLLIQIESKFKIKISDNELFSKKFNNIENIAILIKKKLDENKKK